MLNRRRILDTKLLADINVTLSKLEEKGFVINSPLLAASTKEYVRFYNEWKNKVEDRAYKREYKAEEEKQIKEEKEALMKYQVCGGDTFLSAEKIQSHLGSIDMPKFNKMLTGDFFDDNLMSAMVCIAGSAHVASSSSLAPNERVRAWIRNLRRVGADSVSGYAFMGDAGYNMNNENTAKAPFIIKALRNLDELNEIRHEAFIGLIATNHLRKLVPNFAYIYGSFECSGPISGPASETDPKSKKIAGFCNTTGKASDTLQLIYENVTPGKSVDDSIKEWDGRDFMRYFLALMMALHKGHERYKFTHYDLHGGNVIMRECTDERYLKEKELNKDAIFYVEYTLNFEDGTSDRFYVASSGAIPTIIDYGRSYVEVEGRSYGMPNSIYYNRVNLFQNKSNPMYDVFKFLGFSLARAYDVGNYKLFAEIAPLFRYFNVDEGIFDILIERSKNSHFSLPLPSDLSDLSHFINFAVKYSDAMEYEDVISKNIPEGSFLLSPVSDRLSMQIYKDLGLSDESGPVTILEFYDVLTKIKIAVEFYRGNQDPIHEEVKKDIVEEYGVFTHDEKERKRIIRDLIIKYRKIRDSFALRNIYKALEYEINRLSDIINDFCLGTKNEVQTSVILSEFSKMEDCTRDLTLNLSFMRLPRNINMYYNEEMLNIVKNYIGKFALFADMRQSFIVSIVALEYTYTAYKILKPNQRSDNHNEIVNKVYNLYSYLFDLVTNLEDTYSHYVESILPFINLFSKMDVDKDYIWYKSTAITLPSLFLDKKKKKKLGPEN